MMPAAHLAKPRSMPPGLVARTCPSHEAVDLAAATLIGVPRLIRAESNCVHTAYNAHLAPSPPRSVACWKEVFNE